jgi:uncharacterized protein YkwD
MRWPFAGSSVVAAAVALLPLGQVLADPAPAPSSDPPAAVMRVLDLTNTERGKAGLAALSLNPKLTLAAQGYSQVLASGTCFEHTCGPVPNFTDRDVAAGYVGWTALGENLAGGFMTPDSVVAGWMGSATHRANILSANFTDIGIGVSSGSSQFGMCWAEEFGAGDEGDGD